MTFTSRSSIDLLALHAAYLAEGFVVIPVPAHHDPVAFTCYRKEIGESVCTELVPNVPADDSDLYDKLEELHPDAEASLRFLWEVTGNAHCEVGSLVMGK